MWSTRIIHAVDPLVIVHVIAAVALLVATGVVGIWGLVRTAQVTSPERPREGALFSQLLQLSHTLVLAAGLVGLLLLAEGHRLTDLLHARVYGPFMVVAVVAAYGYRTADARLNVRIFAVAALIIFALGLRAVWTGA
ncbi:MAG: hypothetical protein JWO69_1060 [Thermoleophilia bacterium]|jgi:hypothetical protein|nr:hypothetical protein [Thermoleophilia bacterium]